MAINCHGRTYPESPRGFTIGGSTARPPPWAFYVNIPDSLFTGILAFLNAGVHGPMEYLDTDGGRDPESRWIKQYPLGGGVTASLRVHVQRPNLAELWRIQFQIRLSPGNTFRNWRSSAQLISNWETEKVIIFQDQSAFWTFGGGPRVGIRCGTYAVLPAGFCNG